MNFREGWRGHLWQGQFVSFPLDKRYLLAAIHVARRDDALAKTAPLLARLRDCKGFLCADAPAEDIRQLRLQHAGQRAEPFQELPGKELGVAARNGKCREGGSAGCHGRP